MNWEARHMLFVYASSSGLAIGFLNDLPTLHALSRRQLTGPYARWRLREGLPKGAARVAQSVSQTGSLRWATADVCGLETADLLPNAIRRHGRLRYAHGSPILRADPLPSRYPIGQRQTVFVFSDREFRPSSGVIRHTSSGSLRGPLFKEMVRAESDSERWRRASLPAVEGCIPAARTNRSAPQQRSTFALASEFLRFFPAGLQATAQCQPGMADATFSDTPG
jgi:hypothetical protein